MRFLRNLSTKSKVKLLCSLSVLIRKCSTIHLREVVLHHLDVLLSILILVERVDGIQSKFVLFVDRNFCLRDKVVSCFVGTIDALKSFLITCLTSLSKRFHFSIIVLSDVVGNSVAHSLTPCR